MPSEIHQNFVPFDYVNEVSCKPKENDTSDQQPCPAAYESTTVQLKDNSQEAPGASECRINSDLYFDMEQFEKMRPRKKKMVTFNLDYSESNFI